MTTEKPLDEMVTLLVHHVRFPAQTLPNKPEFFGLSPIDFPKKAISLGKLKLFPEDVWEEVFGSYKNSPMAKLNLVRSRLQFFIETNTYPFMNGLANALPNEKIIELDSMIEVLRKQFNEARDEYISHYDNLKIASITYWKGKASQFNLSEDQMKAAIVNRFFRRKELHKKFLFGVSGIKVTPCSELDDEKFSPEVIAARKKVVADAEKDYLATIKDFKFQVIQDLRNGVSEAMESLHDAINGGHWNQKSIHALKRYLDGVESMNLMDDKKLQEVVDDIRSELNLQDAKKIKKDSWRKQSIQSTLKHHIKLIGELTVPEIQEAKLLDDAEDEIMNVGRIVDPF